jgi:hypothetical protein
MRLLAIARLRLLTRIRTASVLYALATLPPLMPCVFASLIPENAYRESMPFLAPVVAVWSILVWILHTGILLIGSEAGEQLHPRREGAEWSDLLETVPLDPSGRFAGEAVGSLAVNLSIHICALPVLAVVVALSPLPLSVFMALECGTLALLSLGAGAAAWKRCASPSKWSATRMARSGVLFWILFVAILYQTSRWQAFVSSLQEAIFQPSRRSWQQIGATIERPASLALLVALLCLSYLAFYYVSSVRALARRREI